MAQPALNEPYNKRMADCLNYGRG